MKTTFFRVVAGIQEATNAGIFALFAEESLTVLKNYVTVIEVSHCHADKI